MLIIKLPSIITRSTLINCDHNNDNSNNNNIKNSYDNNHQ